MFFHAASGNIQIKKVCIKVLGRGIYLKNTFLNESAKVKTLWVDFQPLQIRSFLLPV